jgi:uncharacterized protein (TIGR03435 family)
VEIPDGEEVALIARHCLSAVFLSAILAAQAPVFEVVSVKPVSGNDHASASMRGGPGTSDEDRMIFTSVTLMNVLARAYDVKPHQITGPDWLSVERYDILAKVPPGSTKQQVNLMLQNVLAERFHVVLHHQTKDLQGYELRLAKNGPKLKASAETATGSAKPDEQPKTDANGFPRLDATGLAMMEGVKGRAVISYLTAKGQPISALVDQLSKEFRLPILDKTGLNGKFDFTLEFAPQAPGALAPDSTGEGAANLLTAVEQQLGLKLYPRKIPVDVLIIDRADKVPTEN